MMLEKQVCTFEQAKKLKELFVVQKSIFYYHPGFMRPVFGEMMSDANLMVCNDKENSFSAFNVAELGVMLPDKYLNKSPFKHEQNRSWHVMMLVAQDGFEMHDSFDTEAQARAALLIYLLENKLIQFGEINQRLKL